MTTTTLYTREPYRLHRRTLLTASPVPGWRLPNRAWGTSETGPHVAFAPRWLQRYTGFVAAIPAGAKESSALKAFIEFLRTPEAAAVMKQKGMQGN